MGIKPLAHDQVSQLLRLYEIVSLIGAGGMGDVYRTRDTKLKREVPLQDSATQRSWVQEASRWNRELFIDGGFAQV
jgi:hypothetical protein